VTVLFIRIMLSCYFSLRRPAENVALIYDEVGITALELLKASSTGG